ncbi:MAG: SDR family oxidoreductase [Bacteroidota bacterium]
MKVIVFGATGTVGKEIVQQALEQGHQVTAFLRSPEKMEDIQHSRLQTFQGDVFDEAQVAEAIKGQDIVMVSLGSGRSRKSIVRSKGTEHIIQAMKKEGVKRLICQTTLGNGDSRANLDFFWKYIMFGWFLKQVYLDHELQEELVRKSGLDWTIVRPAAFTDGERTGAYQSGFGPHVEGLTLKISRKDVADFMLKQIGNPASLFQTPGLSY